MYYNDINEILRIAGVKLNESIVYASKNDLSDVVLMNPTRKELKDNNLTLCRCIEDSEGNWYFADMENMLHAYIVSELKDEASFPLFDGNDCYGIAYYDAESNEFWYNLNDYMYKKECIEQYNNSEYLRTTFPNARVIPNPWNNQMYDELYDEDNDEDLNESYGRMDRPFIWNDPTYSQFHRILRDNTTYGKLSAIIDNGHIYCWDSALSHHDSVVKDIEESGIKLSDDYIWVRFKEPNLCWVSAAYFDDYTDEDLEDLPQQDFEKELEENPIIRKYFPQGVKVVRFDNISESVLNEELIYAEKDPDDNEFLTNEIWKNPTRKELRNISESRIVIDYNTGDFYFCLADCMIHDDMIDKINKGDNSSIFYDYYKNTFYKRDEWKNNKEYDEMKNNFKEDLLSYPYIKNNFSNFKVELINSLYQETPW